MKEMEMMIENRRYGYIFLTVSGVNLKGKPSASSAPRKKGNYILIPIFV